MSQDEDYVPLRVPSMEIEKGGPASMVACMIAIPGLMVVYLALYLLGIVP